MQSGNKSNAGLRKHDIKKHQVTAANLEHATAMFTTMTVNEITTEDTLTVYESTVGNSSNPVEEEPTENKSAVREPAIGERAIDEFKVDESDLIESKMEESDFDDSDTEVSDIDLHDFEAYYSNIDNFDVYENTVENVVADVHNIDEFKHFVNYIGQCNNDQHFIVKMHTKAIYNLKPLAKEPSALQLGRFTEKLVLHIWVLQMQDSLDIDRWSGLLMHIIYSKLDQVTRNLWNTFVWNYKIRGRKISMTTILDFLRTTCREYKTKKPPISLSCINYVYNDLNSEC